METITFRQPRSLTFGRDCALQCGRDLAAAGFQRLLLVASPSTARLAEPLLREFHRPGTTTTVMDDIRGEPTLQVFEEALLRARQAAPDVVAGMGGGSPLDVAKLVAALHDSPQQVREVLGIGLLARRRTHLVCLPTTAGTGSEVSPNAILLDELDSLKKGVISPHLVPDAAYVDPLLTLSLPPAVTAATGLDALTHCIEAYTNRFAHPLVDLYALEGIRLMAAFLPRAVAHGEDVEAREAVARASLYGGICLGPVNTAAVHALAYPLGGEFHVPHGLSNALLLPHVMEFNLVAAPRRSAEVALALGAAPGDTEEATARNGVARIRALMEQCRVPTRMASLGVPEAALPAMASAAMTVTRLLKNNPRPLTCADAEAIYRAAW